MRMCINESRAHELPMSKPTNDEFGCSGPTITNKDVVQFVLVRVVHNEGDCAIRFDPQDGTGNVLDLRGSQGVNQGPNEDFPACLWHGNVGEFECTAPCGGGRGKGGEQGRDWGNVPSRVLLAFGWKSEAANAGMQTGTMAYDKYGV
jgi:hypothetical protein